MVNLEAWQNPACGKQWQMWQNGGKTNLEVENNRPNQSKNKFWISIDNVFCSDVNKSYLEYFLRPRIFFISIFTRNP